MKKTLKLTPRRCVALRSFEETLPCAFPRREERSWSGLTRTATLRDWLLHWLEDEIRPVREQTTYYCYANIIHSHLIPALGQVRLCDVTPRLLESYYDWAQQSKGLTANTVRKHHVLLHTALKLAYCQGLLRDNPTDRTTPPRPTSPRQTFYNAAQAARLLSIVRGQVLEVPVKLACCLGLRRSEIAGLRWCDVDLAGGSIAIRQVRTAAGGDVICKAPKTAGSMRTLNIQTVPGMLELLREQRGRCEERCAARGVPFREDLCVAVDGRGRPWSPDELTREFSVLVERSGLPKVTLHGLRHTFASVANDARVPMLEISKTLGHSDPSITARVYTHMFDQTYGEVLSAVAAGIAAS